MRFWYVVLFFCCSDRNSILFFIFVGLSHCVNYCSNFGCGDCAKNATCVWCNKYDEHVTDVTRCMSRLELNSSCSSFCAGDDCHYVCSPPKPPPTPPKPKKEKTCESGWLYPCAPQLGGNFLLMLMYGAILAISAKWISDGSEMLLVILPPGLIGGFVLPVLGAVPDAAIIIFSGLGSQKQAQEQVAVGMGTLAGSTIMLLTIPFGLSIVLGKCDIKDGVQQDKKDTYWLFDPRACWFSGVTFDKDVPINACISMITSLSYFLVQGVAFYYLFKYEIHEIDDKDKINITLERWVAFGAMFVCFFFFVAYSVFQFCNSGSNEKKAKQVLEEHEKAVNVGKYRNMAEEYHTLFLQFKNVAKKRSQMKKERDDYTRSSGFGSTETISLDSSEVLAGVPEFTQRAAKKLGRMWRSRSAKHSGRVYHQKEAEEDEYNEEMEIDDSLPPVEEDPVIDPTPIHTETTGLINEVDVERKDTEEEEEDEDEEDEEFAHWPWWKVLAVACFWMVIGTTLVTFFSDPMVDVINQTSKIMGLPSFFVSFVVTPLCSNASELIASLIFASKKKTANNTISFSQLYGASIMNNTLCLGIFFLLVFAQGLEWTFSAETLVIFLATIFMGVLGLCTCFTKFTLRLWCIFPIFAVYPISLLIVFLLEHFGHWK